MCSSDLLDARLPNYFVGARRLFCRIGRGHPFDATLFKGLDAARSKTRRSGDATPTEIVDLGVALHELRIRKTDEEVSAMAAAAVNALTLGLGGDGTAAKTGTWGDEGSAHDESSTP